MSSQNNITLESKDSITALISLGANLPSRFGTPVQTLSAAITRIAGFGNGIFFASSFYQTEAVDCQPATPDFINAVVAVPLPKSITASELLDFLQELEKEFGRSHDGVIDGNSTEFDASWSICVGAGALGKSTYMP